MIIRFPVALTALLAATALMAVSGEDVPPGAAARGYLLLGEKGSSLSINIVPTGASMFLNRGLNATATDSIGITVDGAWKLTVEDVNGVGKMMNSEKPLSNKLLVLVKSTGGNNALPESVILTDCTDLSSPKTIALGFDEFNSYTVGIVYSQKAIEEDASGAYLIDLRYRLSSNT